MPKRIKIKVQEAFLMMPYKTPDGTIVFYVLNKRGIVKKLNNKIGQVTIKLSYIQEKNVIRLDMQSEKPPYRIFLYCYPNQLEPAIAPEAKAVVFIDENFMNKEDITDVDVDKLRMFNLTNEFRVVLKKIEEMNKNDVTRENSERPEEGSEGSSGGQDTTQHGSPNTTSDRSGDAEGKEESPE